MMKLFQQSPIGFRGGSSTYGTVYVKTAFETEVIVYALVYLACILDPIMYFAINPDYRRGAINVWNHLYCNKDPVQVR